MDLTIPKFSQFLPLVFCVLLAGCDNSPNIIEDPAPQCTPASLPTQLKAVFVDDLLPNATSITPVAVFRFNQSIKSYSNTSCKTKANECQTKLLIQNISGYTMGISYTINYSQGNNFWTSDGYANIAPDSTFDAGVVTLNCGWVSSGSMIVTKRAVIYNN